MSPTVGRYLTYAVKTRKFTSRFKNKIKYLDTKDARNAVY